MSIIVVVYNRLEKEMNIMLQNINLIFIILTKYIDLLNIIFSNISIGDFANVVATMIIAVLGHNYTKSLNKKIEKQEETARLAQYQTITTVDDTEICKIKLNIATYHNFTNYSERNVLKTDSRRIINGKAYAFDLEVCFKSFSKIIPNQIRIKQIMIYDTLKDNNEYEFEQIAFTLNNDEYKFKSLTFENNMILGMTCLCCITKEEYEKFIKHNFEDKYINIQFIYEVINQFNVITELNTRAIFKVLNNKDIQKELPGKKMQINLKLVKAYSNINKTYEQN